MKKVKKEFLYFIEDGINNFKMIKTKKGFLKQIPNLLTLLRLIILPFVLYYFFKGELLIAGVLTTFSVFTDLFDGMYARKFNAITKFGAKFDAFSDKLFAITVMLSLVTVNKYIIIPIILDILIGLVNSFFYIRGRDAKTSIFGKFKTLFLDFLMCSVFFTNYSIGLVIKPLFYITIFLQVVTLYTYFKRYYKKK